MDRDRDKELQDLLQIAYQSGVPVITPEPLQPHAVVYEVKVVISESGTEIKNADS